MSVRRLAPVEMQPDSFAFSAGNADWAGHQITKYPKGRQASAVIPLLWKAQEQAGGWVPQKAIEHVADMLAMPYIRVLEIATFYTMFNLEPVGRYFIQLCGTVPCGVCGAADLKAVCKDKIGPEKTVSADGNFSWLEVECLGACCNAPMVQINNDYYEDLNAENFARVLDDLAAGRPVKVGPQSSRRASEPIGGAKTLTDPALYDGSVIGSWRKRFEQETIKAEALAEAARAAPSAAANAEPAKPQETRPEEKASDTPDKWAADGMEPLMAALVAVAAPKSPPAAGAAPAPPEPVSAGAAQPDVGQPAPVSDADKPELLGSPRGGVADDLKLIRGVGPKLEQMLNRLGVYHFEQIAGWSEPNLAWVDQNLGSFRGRAVRDRWTEQAKKLATGWRPAGDIGEKSVD
jgi:NADH-quinone oxidoreductase subunit E